jgi:hypothetical protein
MRPSACSLVLAASLALSLTACDGGQLQAPPACSTLDPAGCAARHDCMSETCGGGCGVAGAFTCYDPAHPPPCAQLALPCVRVPCASLGLADCEPRADCHAVFADPGTCDCETAGCCLAFSACATGKPADCSGDAVCQSLPPACGPNRVVSVANGCWEGCVRPEDCGPLTGAYATP